MKDNPKSKNTKLIQIKETQDSHFSKEILEILKEIEPEIDSIFIEKQVQTSTKKHK